MLLFYCEKILKKQRSKALRYRQQLESLKIKIAKNRNKPNIKLIKQVLDGY